MMYGMFGEQILNNVLFALKRADNLPTDIYGAFKRLCQNADTAFFYAQSPDFLKPGLCYYPKFSYL